MGKQDDRAAREELKAAREALAKLPPRDKEDEEYWAANRRVLEAEKRVSWWRR